MAGAAMQPSIPSFKLPVVDSGGFANQAWRQFWTGLGNGSGSTGDTIYVNPGTGTNTRLLNAALADYANVNDYLSNGDANYDGAFARALSDKNKVYVPRDPWLGGRTYKITLPIEISDGQAIFGDGGGITQIEQQTTNLPAIFINDDIYDFQIRNLWLSHAGTPIANGDGIAQGQGLHSWVNGGVIADVWTFNCYRGFNLGKAFSAVIQNCFVSTSIERGIVMTSTGLSEVGVTPQNGPLQWVLEGCGVGESGSDAFAYISTATGAAFSAPISVGTLLNCSTFGNRGNGVAAYGNAAGPIFSVRVESGFYGQDTGHEIHLDTWGNGHVIRPTEIELAGGCGVHITGNGTNSNFQNSRTIIEVGLINGCGLEGVFSQAPNTKINGGFLTNNGLLGTASRQNGIQIFSGGGSNPASGSIVGVDAYDTGAGTQIYGIASNVDGLLISACNLVGNITAPIALPTIVNTIITGCLPSSINVGAFGLLTTQDLYVSRSVGITTPPDGVAGHIAGSPLAFTGASINMTGSLAVTLNVQMASLYATVSAGIGIAPSGTAGELEVNGPFHALAASAFFGNLILAANGITLGPAGGITGTELIAEKIAATDSMIVGSPTGSFQTGSVNVPTSFLVNNVAVGGGGGPFLPLSGGTMAGNIAMGGNSISGIGTASGSASSFTSAGVGTSASGTSGRLDVGGIVVGSPSGGYSAGDVNAQGTVYADVGMVTVNFALTGGIYNPSATGTLLGPGTINMASGLFVNSVPH